MLYFNDDKFDFRSVYESIKRFYPIGVRKDDSRLYYSYPGLKELEAIIVDNIHNGKHFEERWERFTNEIASAAGKEVIGTTYGQAPSFSAFILLEQTTLDNLTRTKELHFFVSLVGAFYTIIGEDVSTVNIKERHYRSTNYLVLSPENEFAESFRFICDSIQKRFQGYRFIPFELNKQEVDGLEVHYTDEHLNKVFHALFNGHLQSDTRRTIGDSYYKMDDWIKEGNMDKGSGWTSYPPIE